ncbi:MAG: MoxR family ATPase [Acidobacteria bacterium]|nr:MAG: MoxR family ATPase [Acidobacteriota bacterium]REK10500.1 MAG: MoxR family ATPase [Acidobacteriota bacterium]
MTSSPSTAELSPADTEQRLHDFQVQFDRAAAEIGKVIVGQKETVDALLTCLLAGGHVLLEGIPGIGKTKLVQTLGDVLRLDFSRIQFTPDLMPGDIIGTQILQEDEHGNKSIAFRPGPIFTHLLLADEINRATPKTQSALLEAMQERTVSVGDVTHRLDEPFFVLATQNPLEMEGTFPLPEAQLDRFFMKLRMTFPTRDELREILDRTTGTREPVADRILTADGVLDLRRTVRALPIADELMDFAIRLTLATHPESELCTANVRRFARIGASPRGAQGLVLAGKVHALMHGRAHVAAADLQAMAPPILRHRLLLNFEGEAEGIDTDDLIAEILEHTPAP